MNDTRRRPSPDVGAREQKDVERLLAQYHKGDNVIYKDSDGNWKSGPLIQDPEKVHGKGKISFRFKIRDQGGSTISVIADKPLRKVQGDDLIKDIQARPIEINGKHYGGVALKFGPNGEEEFSLKEKSFSLGTTPDNEDVSYIDAQTLRSIVEGARAVEDVRYQAQQLLGKIKTLEGIKVKELVQGVARLESKSRDILKVLGKESDWNDLEQSEIETMNKEVERLKEEVDRSLRELRQRVDEHEEVHNENKDSVERKRLAQKIRDAYNKKMRLSDRAFAIRERARLAEWENYERELADWERQNQAQGRGRGRATPRPKPLPPGGRGAKKPVKPSDQEEEKRKVLDEVLNDLKDKGINLDPLNKAIDETIDSSDDKLIELLAPQDAEAYRQLLGAHEQHLADQKAANVALLALDIQKDDLHQQSAQLEKELDELEKQFEPLYASNEDEMDVYREIQEEIQTAENEENVFKEQQEELKKTYRSLENEEQQQPGRRRAQEIARSKANNETRQREINIQLDDLKEKKKGLHAQIELLLQRKPELRLAIDIENKMLEKRNEQKRIDEEELPRIDQEKENQLIQLRELEDELHAFKRESEKIRNNAGSRLGELRNSVVLDILDSWEKIELKPDAELNFENEKAALELRIEKLRGWIKQVPRRETREALLKKLELSQSELDDVKKKSPTLENDFLVIWQDLGKLEVEIYEAVPGILVEAQDGEERFKEAREVREGRIDTHDVPSTLIKEVLAGRERELSEIVTLIYTRALEEKKEGNVELIYAQDDITQAVRNLLPDQFKPTDADLVEWVRRAGIKDWGRFKALWDEQYASQIGLILQEEAQAMVRKEFEHRLAEQNKAKEAYESRSWLGRKFNKPPKLLSENDLRNIIQDEFLSQERAAGGTDISYDSFNKFSGLVAVAMRQINLEIKMSQTEDPEARKALLKGADTEEQDYIVLNGQYFVKGAKEKRAPHKRFIADEAGDKINIHDLTPKEITDGRTELKTEFDTIAGYIRRLEKKILSPQLRRTLEEKIGALHECLNGIYKDNRVRAVLLKDDYLLEDQAKDLIYEFNRIKEREKLGETFRAVREAVVEQGEKVKEADKAAGGIVEPMTEAAEEEPPKKAAKTKKKGMPKWAKYAALGIFGLSLANSPAIWSIFKHHKEVPRVESVQRSAEQRGSGGAMESGENRGGGSSAVSSETARAGGSGTTQVGSVENRTLTTTAVEFDGGMMEKLDTVTQNIYKGEMTVNVLDKTSSIKTLINDIDNNVDRKAAMKGFYSLIDKAGAEGGEAARKNLKEVLDLAGSSEARDNENAIKKIVELGKPLVQPPAAPKAPRQRAPNA